jgi:hypothetical protein
MRYIAAANLFLASSGVEHGVANLRPLNGQRTIADQLTLGLIEGVMTLAGLVVLVFPLALWAVPQHGPLANTIFYIVLSIGGGSFFAVIGLAYLKGWLFPDPSPRDTPVGGKARLQAYLTWSQSQADVRRVEKQLRSVKGGALHDFGYMVRIAALLSTIFVLSNLAAWAYMDFTHGSTKIISAAERYQLLHPDPWGWGREKR